MPDLSDLKPEARAELAEFEAHLRAHHAVAQLDCRFCLLRMTRRGTRPVRTCRTPYRGSRVSASWLTAYMADAVPEEPRPHFHCGRCGAREVTPLPMTIEAFDTKAKAFVAVHRECAATPPEDQR